MDLSLVIFSVIFFFVIFVSFTEQGRNIFRKLTVGEVVEDYGYINEDEFGGNQKIKLLKCKKNHETFYVLEVQSGRFGNKRVEWIKLSYKTVQILLSKLK